MLAKSWKKILIIILVIACIWNFFVKFSKVVNFNDTITSIKTAIQRELKLKK